MLRDLKLALRGWVKAPGFTAVALLTLALGIGANIAIFNLVDAILLRPLSVPHPEQLTALTNPTSGGVSYGTSDGNRGLLAYSEYKTLRDQTTVFSGLAAMAGWIPSTPVDWSLAAGGSAGGAQAEMVSTEMVSGNYFLVLGVNAYRGRTFTPSEVQNIGADPVAVMSYAYWTQRFNRAPGAIGRTFRIHGNAFTVIGVTPPGFFGTNVGASPELFLPITMANEVAPGRDWLHDPPGVSRLMWLQALGRRKPGISLAMAQAECNVVFLRLVQAQAGAATDAQQRRDLLNQKLKLSAGGAGFSGVRGQYSDSLLVLLALVGLVLLLAIANLASLQLARSAGRQKEMGIRLALGAPRSRIVRQLLTESLLLAAAGGGLGAGLALWGDRLLLAMAGGSSDPIVVNLHPDLAVLGFVAGVCVLAGVLFGLAPALKMARLDINPTLQAAGRSWTRRGWPLGKLLVMGQIALSVILVAGAGVFVRSLQKLNDVPLGFQPQNLIEFNVDAGAAGYKDQAAVNYFHALQQRIEAVPGVQSATLSMDGLFAGSECGLPLIVHGHSGANGQAADGARCDEISDQYFSTTGIPMLLGRPLEAADATSGVKNAVINQTMQRRFFNNRNPIGEPILDAYPDDHGVVYTVVGVAGDAKYNDLGEKTPPRMYLSFFNGIPGDPSVDANVLVRGRGEASGLDAGIRAAVRGLDPGVTIGPFGTMTEAVAGTLRGSELMAKLSGFFGLLALLLAAIGVYGVMAYGVERRTGEIGVRMTLGAERNQVLGMVLGETAVVAGIGIAAGIPLSFAGVRIALSQIHLFGVSNWDWPTFLAAAVTLAVAALLAGALPARRASRIDPWRALREE